MAENYSITVVYVSFDILVHKKWYWPVKRLYNNLKKDLSITLRVFLHTHIPVVCACMIVYTLQGPSCPRAQHFQLTRLAVILCTFSEKTAVSKTIGPLSDSILNRRLFHSQGDNTAKYHRNLIWTWDWTAERPKPAYQRVLLGQWGV